MRDAEVDAVVHHLAEGLELALRDIELNDLRRGHVTGPVEGLRLIAANDQDVLFVYHHNLALGYFPIVDLEGRPPERFEVVEGMLVELGEVEQLLGEAVGFGPFAPLVEKLLEPLVLRRHIRQLVVQVSYAVMVLLRVLMPDELAVVAPEDNGRAVDLMLEDVLVVADLFAAAFSVAALKFYLCKEVSSDAVDLVELRVAAAEWTVVGIFGKPVTLAVRTDRFFADLALQGIL